MFGVKGTRVCTGSKAGEGRGFDTIYDAQVMSVHTQATRASPPTKTRGSRVHNFWTKRLRTLKSTPFDASRWDLSFETGFSSIGQIKVVESSEKLLRLYCMYVCMSFAPISPNRVGIAAPNYICMQIFSSLGWEFAWRAPFTYNMTGCDTRIRIL